MPRVPTYDEFQATPQVLGPTRVDAPMSPAMAAMPGQQQQQYGQATIQSGNVQAQIALDIQKDVNEAATKEADNTAAQVLNTLLHDPKSGYLNTQGKEALDRREDAQKYAQDSIERAGEGLTNDMQRRMFTDVARRRMLMAQEQINVHAAAQTKVYNETETTKRMDNSRKDAVANWALWNTGKVLEDGTKEPNAFSTAKATMLAEVNQLAAMKGFAPDSETAKALRLTQTTLLHGDIINTMLSADRVKDAKEYYAKNSTEIDPEKRDEFNKVLNTAGTAEESIKLARAMSIMSDGRSLVQQREELDQMLEKGDITPAVHKETMQQLVQLHTINKAEQAEQNATKASNLELDMKTKGDLQSQLAELDSMFKNGQITAEVRDNTRTRLKENYQTDKAIQDARTTSQSTTLALTLRDKGGLNAQLATLDTMFKSGQITAEVRDNTRQRLEHDFQVKKAMQAEGEKAVIGSATDWFVQHPGASILDFQKANPKAYNALKNSGHLSGIVSFARGNKVDNDPATWAQVMSNPQELKSMTPTDIYNKYRLRLDDSHLDRLYAMNAALNGSKDEQHLSILSTSDMVKNSAVRMNLLPASGKASESQAKAFDDFQNQIDGRVATYEATVLQGKRKANQEELKKILQEVEMDKVYQRRTLLPNKEVPLISVPASEMGSVYVNIGNEEIPVASIPAAQRALIIPALRRAGKPATEQNIADFWVRGGKKK